VCVYVCVCVIDRCACLRFVCQLYLSIKADSGTWDIEYLPSMFEALEKKNKSRPSGVTQVVEHLPSKHEFKSQYCQKKKKKKKADPTACQWLTL
jgi:hypothetical protein